MKITNIKTYRMQVPLVRPFRIALGLITHAVSCLVEIETDAGITGYGEGSPGPLITGENLEKYLAGEKEEMRNQVNVKTGNRK